MTTPDNSATEKPWDVQQHGNLFCVRGPSAIPNCTEESYWYEHEQRAQWLCDALNLAAALHSANEKLRGECERLPKYADAGTPMLWGDEVWIGPDETHVGVVKDIYPNGIELQRDSGIVYFPSSRCFSTREAAARAAEGGED